MKKSADERESIAGKYEANVMDTNGEIQVHQLLLRDKMMIKRMFNEMLFIVNWSLERKINEYADTLSL